MKIETKTKGEESYLELLHNCLSHMKSYSMESYNGRGASKTVKYYVTLP